MRDYNKPPLDIHQQIDLFIKRGLKIENRASAETILSGISYYRLRGYTYPFQENKNYDHPFKPGVSLDDIIMRYEFDRKLRLLVMDALERVEIAFRTQLVLHMSLEHGPWWFEQSRLFRNPEYHLNDLAELDSQINRSSEKFISHHRSVYGTAKRPPAWKCFEAISFGLVSKFFSNIKSSLDAKKQICLYFGLDKGGFRILESWMQHFTVVRNICAHHSRLWDRDIRQEPVFAKNLAPPWIRCFPDNRKIYKTLSLLSWLSNLITDDFVYGKMFSDFIQAHDYMPVKEMGFPGNWMEEDLWKT